MKTKYFIMLVVLSFLTTGCYLNDEVETNQMAVQLDENKIQQVVGPGVYTDMGFFADLKTTDVDTQTFSVEDPEVLTKDNQAVGVKITIQARRKSDKDSIENLFTNWAALIDNAKLVETISATAREGLKNGVRGYTLPQLLDDRNGLADVIREQLERDSSKYGVEVVNVTIENIAPSVDYMAILAQTANLKAETDKELQRQTLIKQTAETNIIESEQRVDALKSQLLAEQAQTSVEVEIARRQGEIVAAANQVYLDNAAAFRLEELKRMKDIFGDKAVFFVPSDTNIILNPQGLIPVE